MAIENIHHGQHLRKVESLRELGTPAASLLDELLDQGRRDGVFRDGVEAVDVHMLISAYCVFQIANNHTFGYLFDRDMESPGTRAAQQAIARRPGGVSWLRRPPAAPDHRRRTALWNSRSTAGPSRGPVGDLVVRTVISHSFVA